MKTQRVIFMLMRFIDASVCLDFDKLVDLVELKHLKHL